jgi:hypothetical protein
MQDTAGLMLQQQQQQLVPETQALPEKGERQQRDRTLRNSRVSDRGRNSIVRVKQNNPQFCFNKHT